MYKFCGKEARAFPLHIPFYMIGNDVSYHIKKRIRFSIDEIDMPMRFFCLR